VPSIDSQHINYRNFLEQKYRRLVEEAYNLQFTDHSLSDILTFEAMQIYQKINFLRLS